MQAAIRRSVQGLLCSKHLTGQNVQHSRCFQLHIKRLEVAVTTRTPECILNSETTTKTCFRPQFSYRKQEKILFPSRILTGYFNPHNLNCFPYFTRKETCIIHTNFTTNWLRNVFIYYYTKRLHVSAIYPGHLQRVTILVDVYSVAI
jgi:hypothetical protein